MVSRESEVLQAKTILNERYVILYQIGQGSYSKVYIGLDSNSPDKLVAIKTEEAKNENSAESSLTYDVEFLKNAQDLVGIPKYFGKGFSANNSIEYIVTEVIGPSIGDLLKFCGGKFTLKTTLMLFL